MSEHRTIRLTDRVLLGGAYRRSGDVVDVRLSVAEDLVRLGVAEPVAPEPAPHTPPVGDDPPAGSEPAGGEPRPSDTDGGAPLRATDRDGTEGAPDTRDGGAVGQDADPPSPGSGRDGGESSAGPLGQGGVQVHDPAAAPRLPPVADSPESTTRVKGIGPATATALADAGVYTLADLAALDDATLRSPATLHVAAEPTLRDWREQAAALLAADTAQA